MSPTRRALFASLAATTVGLTLPGATSPARAATARSGGRDGDRRFPNELRMPTGFFPEGIAIGSGPIAYVTSLANGDVYRLDLRDGTGDLLTAGPGVGAGGIVADAHGRLFVAGGTDGTASVIDSRHGSLLARYELSSRSTFVNDIVLTPDAAWITDSFAPLLYRLPFGPGGRLPAADEVQAVPLTGAITYQAGFNANGIVATPDNQGLLVVQTNTGVLFRVDPTTGVATVVDLGGEKLTQGDGMLLEGDRLYVVQNLPNSVAVVRLNAAGTRGRVVRRITDPHFDTPTTIARFGDRFYLPNARFGHPAPGSAEFTVVAIAG